MSLNYYYYMHDSAQYIVAASIAAEETACNTLRPNLCKQMVNRRPIYMARLSRRQVKHHTGASPCILYSQQYYFHLTVNDKDAYTCSMYNT